MKKQKTVFKSSELAHVWANKAAPIGRTPGSMRFDGDAFYSFGTVIANRVKRNGREAYVLDQERFSPSTTRHQIAARRAISESSEVFRVHFGRLGQSLRFTPASLRDYYLGEFKSIGNHTPSKYAHKRADDLLLRLSRLNSAIEVCEFFGLGSLNLKKLRMSFDLKAAEARKVGGDYQEKLRVRREERRNKECEEREALHARNVKHAIELAESILIRHKGGEEVAVSCFDFGYEEKLLESNPKLQEKIRTLREAAVNRDEKNHIASQCKLAEQVISRVVKYDENEHYFGWKDADIESRPDLVAGMAKFRIEFNKDAIEKWLAGENVKIDSDVSPHFRLEGDEVVTSKGARVPLAHAERSFKFCLAMREKGWKRNGHTHHVGMYQIDEISSAEIVAGCHRIQWDTLIAFGKKMGWTA